jgi:hypothetical protein
MTDSELQRLEITLGITLPAPYLEIMRGFPADLKHWPTWADADGSRTFYSDVDVILNANKKVRENPGQYVKFPKEFRTAWPKNLFVFGDYDDETLYLIDVNNRNPEVGSVSNGAIRPSFPDLASLFRSFHYRHGECWERDRERSPVPPKAPKARLTGDDLQAEARRLARPAIMLSADGEEYAACWQGTGVVPPPPGRWEHWISLDTSFLPDNPRGRGAVLSVYLCTEDDDRFHQVAVTQDHAAVLPRVPDGERLFVHRAACLPPIEAIFRFGSEPIQTWLAANEWNPDWGYNDNFADSGPVETYLKAFQSEHPFFHDEEFYSMLGGWSMCFDEDWATLVAKPLLLLTIRDSEPWLEVYEGGNELLGFSRIT